MNFETLIASLEAEDEADRINAAEDLGYANVAAAVRPLVERLAAERSQKARESIFLALEKIDSPEVLRQMAALFDSDDAFLRNQAVGLLQRKGAASAPVLLAKMRDGDADARKFALDTASRISSPEVEPIYEAAMRDHDSNVLIAALEHVGARRKSAYKSAVEELFAKAAEPMLVCAAFSALLQIGDDLSWKRIRQRYPTPSSVPDWELPWWIRALGDFGAANEIEVFHDVLLSQNGKVARDAIDALDRFQARHGRLGISEGFWRTLQRMLDSNLGPEDQLQLLRLVGGFGAPLEIPDYLAGLMVKGDRLAKLGAIEGIKRLGRPDLLARAREQRGVETDPEVAQALAEC